MWFEKPAAGGQLASRQPGPSLAAFGDRLGVHSGTTTWRAR